MNIVVLSGGVSSERDISLLNAQNICQSLRRQGHNANILDLLYGIDDSRVDNFFTENNSLLDEVILLKNKTATVKDEVEKRFNSLFTAFKYGVPPHGGMAPGIDRMLMLMLDEPNLREVQAFPASSSGQDQMMGSPAELTSEQLEELGIKIDTEEE